MADLPSAHIDISRYLNFFLRNIPLTPAEHKHFVHCEECTHHLAERLLRENGETKERSSWLRGTSVHAAVAPGAVPLSRCILRLMTMSLARLRALDDYLSRARCVTE